jgi:alkyldihydroxyacetonephosphate synthase
MICGSEGTLGVITEVTVAAHRKPQASHYEGWMFRDFPSAVHFLREMIQSGMAPQVVRLSDDEETRITLAMAGMSGIKGGLFNLFRGFNRLRNGCLCIFGWEGERAEINLRRLELAQKAMRAHGVRLGKKVGGRWKDSRFVGPYLRDHLLDSGVLVETFETATTWSNLESLRAAATAAVKATLPDALLECHVSHVYPDGASLYFTVIGKQTEDPVKQWTVAKVAITGAIVQNGGALSHHHGIGSDHLPWMGTRVGNVGFSALAGLKRQLDPTGVMNPGKLIPSMARQAQGVPVQAPV